MFCPWPRLVCMRHCLTDDFNTAAIPNLIYFFNSITLFRQFLRQDVLPIYCILVCNDHSTDHWPWLIFKRVALMWSKVKGMDWVADVRIGVRVFIVFKYSSCVVLLMICMYLMCVFCVVKCTLYYTKLKHLSLLSLYDVHLIYLSFS